MSAREIGFENDGLVWMRIRWEPQTETLQFTEVDGRKWQLDRSQAHLLKLYLEEKLR